MSHSVTFGFSLTSLALSDDGKAVTHRVKTRVTTSHVTWQNAKRVSEWPNGADDFQKLNFRKKLLLVKS